MATKQTRLSCEQLGDRITPATLSLSGGILSIVGGTAGDTVTVTENANANQIVVAHKVGNGVTQSQTFNSNGVTAINVNLGGGANAFNYKMATGQQFDDAKTLNLNLGASFTTAVNVDLSNGIRDNFTLNLTGANGLLGLLGQDAVTVNLGKVDDAIVKVNANLQAGNDVMNVNLLGDLDDDAQVLLNLQGGNGNDTLRVLATADVDIDDDAKLDIRLNGGNGTDTLDVRYTGEIDGILNIRLDGGLNDNRRDTIKLVLQPENDSDNDAIVAIVNRGFGTTADVVV